MYIGKESALRSSNEAINNKAKNTNMPISSANMLISYEKSYSE